MKLLLKISVFLLLPVLGFTGLARAAPLQRLGLEQALKMAGDNALVREEFAEEGRFHSQRERERWRRLYLPSLSVQRTQRTGNLTGQEQERTTDLQLNYLLYAGGRDRAGYRSALHAGGAARLEQQDVLQELGLMTAEAYLRLASSWQRIHSLEIAVEAAEQEAERAERRSQLGLQAGLEVLQSKVALADQRLELEQELQRRRELALQLSHMVRKEVGPETEVEVGEGLGPPPKPLGYYRDWARNHHPAILRAREEQKKAAQEAALQGAVRWPEVSLSAGMSKSDGENETRLLALSVVYRFGGHRAVMERSETQATIEQRFFQADPTAEVSELNFVEERDVATTRFGATFFDFQDAAATAESALLQARLNLARAARLEVEALEARSREIEQRLGALRVARRRHEVETLRVDKNEAELRAYRKAFAAGTVRFEELLEKQTAHSRGGLDRINALVEVRLARLNLRSASGLPLLSR